MPVRVRGNPKDGESAVIDAGAGRGRRRRCVHAVERSVCTTEDLSDARTTEAISFVAGWL